MSKNLRTERTTLNRLPSRGFYDRDTINNILDSNFLCHIAATTQHGIVCIPTAYGRSGDYVYLHGSVKSRLLEAVANGGQVCLTVTQLDGLVLARSVFHSSMNYHSVVVMGQAELVEGNEAKMEALRIITESIWKDRWSEARLPDANELAATSVVRLPITEASAKIRTGPPKDNTEDYALDIWAGVIPLHTTWGKPVPDPQLKNEIELSPSVQKRVSG